jgi:hypothetical protein
VVGIGAWHGKRVSDEGMAGFAGRTGNRHRWRRNGRTGAARSAIAAFTVALFGPGGIVVVAGVAMLQRCRLVLHCMRRPRVRAAERGRGGETLEGQRQQCQPDDHGAQEGFHTPILARRLGW